VSEKRLQKYVKPHTFVTAPLQLEVYPFSVISELNLVPQALLTHNAKVYIAARSQEKAEEAIKELKEETGKEGIFLKLDLADLKAVKVAAEEFQRFVHFYRFIYALFLLSNFDQQQGEGTSCVI